MRRLFIEADELGQLHRPYGVHELFQDHGAGILLTLAEQAGCHFDVLSLKAMHSWAELRMAVKGYDLLTMNVRSWRFVYAKRAAEIFKAVNPQGKVWVGGMHATVAPAEMESVEAFDVIVSREAEATWSALLQGTDLGRVVQGEGVKDLDTLPWIDRSLWPRTPGSEWPLEGPGGWVPGPRAVTQITSRQCPQRCAFCFPAERNHFYCGPRKRSVDNVIGELAYIVERWGEYSSVLFHDSEFLMYPKWLEEFIEKWPGKVGKPFWASCRSDLMVRWPHLAKALRDECQWHCFSIGLESGSQRVLDLMNKGTTVEQNAEAIEMVNRMGDEAVARGERPPVIFANVLLAMPGETRYDAFATMRMLSTIKRGIPSIAWFTPYPGSVLGDQVIADGRSLDSHKRYLRYPNEAKVKDVDYGFYVDLANGVYDRECGFNVRQMMARQGSAGEALV